MLIRIEETTVLWQSEVCPHCKSKTVGGYDHAPERRWRHLNVCQLNSEIVCALRAGSASNAKRFTRCGRRGRAVRAD